MNNLELKNWLVGFVMGLSDKPLMIPPSVYVEIQGDVLYIHKATGNQTGTTLEVS